MMNIVAYKLDHALETLIQNLIQCFFLIITEVNEFQPAYSYIPAPVGLLFHECRRVVNRFTGDARQVKSTYIIRGQNVNRSGFRRFAFNRPVLEGQADFADVAGRVKF